MPPAVCPRLEQVYLRLQHRRQQLRATMVLSLYVISLPSKRAQGESLASLTAGGEDGVSTEAYNKPCTGSCLS